MAGWPGAEGLTSAFGARFDMETDAAWRLSLRRMSGWGMTGAEVLILGLMRYVFVLGFWPFPWLAAPLPERFGRKLVCVVQIAALILLQVPDLPRAMALMIAWPAVAALIWSFGRDTLWLWRNRDEGCCADSGRPAAASGADPAQSSRCDDMGRVAAVSFGTSGSVAGLPLLGDGRAARGLRAGLAVILTLVIVLKLADFAMFTAFSRGSIRWGTCPWRRRG
jgi:hypothetical protein